MKIVFFGTPEYVVPILETLHKSLRINNEKTPIAAVVTQPPKPAGRKKILEFSPVDTWAHKRKIPKFFDPKDIVNNDIRADIGILASYGAIIPKSVINHFPQGILNIHPSLLPNWRGASPVQATIVSGSQAGVTIIKIDEELDHGPIISQFKDEVLPDDTTETLRTRLFKRSAEVLVSLIPAFLQGKIKAHAQDHKKATFTRQIRKEDAFIPPNFLATALTGSDPVKEKWQISFIRDYYLVPNAYSIERFIRAMQPWPIAWTKVLIKNKKLRLKILKARIQPVSKSLKLEIVQLEGKNPVTWKQFQEGYADFSFRS